jgi:chromosome segregation ATPase
LSQVFEVHEKEVADMNAGNEAQLKMELVDVKDLQQQTVDIQAEIAALKEEVSRLEKKIRKLSQNEDEIREQLRAIGASPETSKAEPALHPKDTELDELKSMLESMEKEFKETREVNVRQTHELEALPTNLAAVMNEIETMQQIVHELANEKCVGEKRVAEEKERRREQAKRIVQRLLHSHLAQAFNSFYDRVAQLRDKKAKCQRIIQRLLHTHLAAAFDCFSEAIRLLVAHRTMQEVVAQERKEEALDQARNHVSGMSDMAKTGEEQLSRAVEIEKERRREQAKRIVQRLLHSQLAHAFDSFHNRVAQLRDNKAKCKRIIQKLLQTHLAAAFACFSEAIRLLVAHRTNVKKTISRWRTPVVQKMFERWLEHLHDFKHKVKEDAHAQAKQHLADELAVLNNFKKVYLQCR